MSLIEDYALLSDLESAALVNRDGSIDWCCFPRFDSGACFAALLGTPEHGRWSLAPVGEVRSVTRSYRDDTLVLDTVFETDDGVVCVTDFMPPRDDVPDIVRIVEGREGTVQMRSELVIRFDYGRIVPWVRRIDGDRLAIAGPDALCLRTPVDVQGEDMKTVGEFTVSAGERVPFVLTWFPSHRPPPAETIPRRPWRHGGVLAHLVGVLHVRRRVRRGGDTSLRVLKALTYAPTGGIVAAPTTSLPEWIGGAATGTTATAGCATPRSRSSPCSRPATPRRRRRGGTGCCARSRATRPTSRSCTGSPASAGSTSASSSGCPATRGQAPSASATPRRRSRSSTSTAR